MAIKIIKPGIKLEMVRLRTTCSNCKCVYEFSFEDTVGSPDIRDSSIRLIDCPECKRSKYVSPDSFKRELDSATTVKEV